MAKKESESRTEALAIRVTPRLKQALSKAAKDDGRSVADYSIRALTEHLKDAGYLK